MFGLLLILGLLAYRIPLALSEELKNKQSVTLILTDFRNYPLELNFDSIQQGFQDFKFNIMFINDSSQHDSNQLLIQILSGGGLVTGFFEPHLCFKAHFISSLYNTSLISWNCPRISGDRDESSSLSYRLSPSITSISKAFSTLVKNMKWKSVAIIFSNKGWWPNLAQVVDVQLREIGRTPRYSFLISKNSMELIKNKLKILKRNSCTVIILCLPADDIGRKVLEALDKLNIAQDHGTIMILMDVSSTWQPIFSIPSLNNSLIEISTTTKNHLLIFSNENDFNKSIENTIKDNLAATLSICDRNDTKFCGNFEFRDNFYINDFSPTENEFSNNHTLRLLAKLEHSTENSTVFFIPIENNLEEWLIKHRRSEECEGCENEFIEIITILLILGSSSLILIVLVGAVTFARTQLLRKKVTKGPFKVILRATDFVFPQISDTRRVEEGIEAMLCCWLQQLQEIGVSDIKKPDLLQGRTQVLHHGGGSSSNLSKHNIIIDSRARYNGDLVQMKLVSTNGGEIKDKSIELLVLLHGLRHENLNPFIGCLSEVPRIALVSEYCTRGSLQDVLQQDDIKLDWSFRLSLLTDLVRGMKYLHSTPIRVHGYLTSRNCVIDARWVLKVTDYGLPAFYDYQGITPPTKTARELLWTAPELLRHTSLRKKGTQPGDVYSFGIILQEVVVRGEPFCMLAFTPEEIIEKIKRPPPLIRPSVSKGAAPPEAINIMRQCWAEQEDMRPDFNAVYDQFKKLNHGRKVNIVDTMFQMLEKYSNNLEELIRERTDQLDMEKKKTEQLLNRMLPSSVAEKLKIGLPVDPEEFEQVTIYFSDIVGFTTISAHSTPFQVVDLLNDLYTCFDATINAYNVYKVETIGDAYMVVGGLPVRISDHAEQIATMALDLLHQSGKFRIRHLPYTPLKLRIGLHTGPCCAGVVGLTMPRYCLFGDTVNTASRMESTGAAWRIHLSEATKEKLKDAGKYRLEYRGPTNIKGKGTMHTYWLLGKDGFNKELPDPPSIEESHGLDESLFITEEIHERNCHDSTKTLSTKSDDQSLTSLAKPKINKILPTPVNPSFMKTMELSKFSSLALRNDKLTDVTSSKQNLAMVKSSSSDASMSLGTPVSANEVAAALLGTSTSSLCGLRRHKKIEEEDLSTPYNQYKCLSPKQRSGKLLRRQFSLDRTAEETKHYEDFLKVISPKLCKQNSAGAADLEKIEEISLKHTTTPTSSVSTLQSSFSISVDSLFR